MTPRFNPPPGWPSVAPDEVPPPDWTPGPSVPPAPPDWPFYLDHRGYVTPGPEDAWRPPQTTGPAVPGTTVAVAGRHRRTRDAPVVRGRRATVVLGGLPALVLLAVAVLAATRL